MVEGLRGTALTRWGTIPRDQPTEELETTPGVGVGSMGSATHVPPPVRAPYQVPLSGACQANQQVPSEARAANVTAPDRSLVDATLTDPGPVDAPSVNWRDGSEAVSSAASMPTRLPLDPEAAVTAPSAVESACWAWVASAVDTGWSTAFAADPAEDDPRVALAAMSTRRATPTMLIMVTIIERPWSSRSAIAGIGDAVRSGHGRSPGWQRLDGCGLQPLSDALSRRVFIVMLRVVVHQGPARAGPGQRLPPRLPLLCG